MKGNRRAAQVIEAEIPLPLSCPCRTRTLDAVLEWTDGQGELWMGSQFPSLDKPTLAATLGIDPSLMCGSTLCLAGASLAAVRSPRPMSAAEVAEIAKAAGGQRVMAACF